MALPTLSYSDPAVAAFVAIPLLLVAALAWGSAIAWLRSGAAPRAATRGTVVVAAASIVWLAVTWMVAESGILREWDRRPPPLMLLLGAILALAGATTFSPLGRRLALFVPLWAHVAVQAFRLPLELAMHGMYERGIMPGVMTYTGRNLDIVTGATAIVVAALAANGIGGLALVIAWNLLGLALLVNVVSVAILATPVFSYFGDDNLNVWVTYPPFVWLPAIMVLAALIGHILIFRAVSLQRSRSSRF